MTPGLARLASARRENDGAPGLLHVYVLFHANLAFSRIPTHHYPHVIDQCYWPALDLARDLGLPLAFEFPAATLEIVSIIDPVFCTELARLWAAGRIEVVGSGYVQSIAPLVPAPMNRVNLALGNRIYDELLGQRPTTALVNEQAFSAGVIDHLAEAGYQALIMDWHNPATFHRYPPETKYRPQRVRGSRAATLALLWSHSVSFQKFQRCIHGLLDQEDYRAYVRAQRCPERDRVLPLYTNDLEVFDYRPGESLVTDRTALPGREFARMRHLFSALADEPHLSFATPKRVLAAMDLPDYTIELQSAEAPVPCKKQEKYNLTRWAVCGRDNALLNAQCYEIYSLLCQAEGLADKPGATDAQLERLRGDLAYLWSSDFRSNTTHEKTLAFVRRYGAARGRAIELVRALADQHARQKETVILINPHRAPVNTVVEVDLGALPPRRYPEGIALRDEHGAPVPCQLEARQQYRDGSTRAGRLVLVPRLAARASVSLALEPAEPGDRAPRPTVSVKEDGHAMTITTPSVRVRLLRQRGAAIESLAFPKLAAEPLCGTVPHGAFDNIRYSADFYTGHVVLVTRDGRKLTDLEPGPIELPGDLSAYPIRVPVRTRVPIAQGTIGKTYYIYTAEPRIDIVYEIVLAPTSLASLRLGFVTALPKAFAGGDLHYATVNGGLGVERFPLAGRAVNHGEPVSLLVSSRHCLGATEGWVAIGTGSLGVAITCDRRTVAAVPMIEHCELEEGRFLRVSHSAVELDETSLNLWRGHYTARFSITGYSGELDSVRGGAAATLVPPLSIV